MSNSMVPRGIHKVTEAIAQKGRSLIITETDASKLEWSEIPDGTLKINPQTGIMSVKLEGESNWVPAGLKNDGTVCISKDTFIKEEVFKIESLDDGIGNFIYSIDTGERRHMPITSEGYFTFELEKGTYAVKRHVLEVQIDDTLKRNAISGGITEINEKRFTVNERLHPGQEITARYIQVIRIGNPYPRIFMRDDDPDTSEAEIGDLYIDTDYNLQNYDKYLDDDGRLDWNIIKNKPTSLAGYGIKDNVSISTHTHSYNDLTDLPGIESTIVNKATVATRLENPVKITLAGNVTGEGTLDGSNNIQITTALNANSLTAAITNITGTNDVIGYIKNNSTKVGVITGSLAATVGTYAPIPSGFDRSQCYFIMSPFQTAAAAQTLTYDTTGRITSCSNVTGVTYMSIGLK